MNRIIHVWTTTVLLTLATLMFSTSRSPADTSQKVVTPHQREIVATQLTHILYQNTITIIERVESRG